MLALTDPSSLPAQCTGGVLAGSPLPVIETPGGTVQVPQVLPATSTELAWGRVQGGAGVLARWQEQGRDLPAPLRAAGALP